jgi:CRP/FNR family cyclic AMP-dependent transcriptional regulator
MAVEDILAEVELFSEMPRKDLSRLAKVTVKREYKDGDVIVREGDLGIAFYVVSKGHVDIVRGLGTKDEQVIFTHSPGGFFGEMALFDNQLRSASARAKGDAECLVLTKWDFGAEVNAPGSRVAVAMLPILARRIRQLNEAAATH